MRIIMMMIILLRKKRVKEKNLQEREKILLNYVKKILKLKIIEYEYKSNFYNFYCF